MKKILISSLLIILSLNSYSQVDENALAIFKNMEKVKDKIKSMKVEFEVEIINRQNQNSQIDSGYAIIKKDKYFLNYNNSKSYFNGNTLATYLPEDEEVTLTHASKDDDNIFNISNVFNIYKKGHKGQFVGEFKNSGKNYYQVRLFPEDLERKYRSITIDIDKKTILPYKLVYSRKDGLDLTIKMYKFDTKYPITEETFEFNEAKYPDIDVVDMRE